MNLDKVTSGRDMPNEVSVVIEIPAHSDPAKYEVDKASVEMFQDAQEKPNLQLLAVSLQQESRLSPYPANR